MELKPGLFISGEQDIRARHSTSGELASHVLDIIESRFCDVSTIYPDNVTPTPIAYPHVETRRSAEINHVIHTAKPVSVANRLDQL